MNSLKDQVLSDPLRPEHTRFVYGLQEGSTSDESDGELSDGSSSGRSKRISRLRPKVGKTRMSLLTGKYFEVQRLEENSHGYFDYGCGHVGSNCPTSLPGNGKRRRFFQSIAQWDEKFKKMVFAETLMYTGRSKLPDMMEKGGWVPEERESDEEMDADEED